MFRYTRPLILLLLIQGFLASSLLARPDVGFPDTDSYLEAQYNEENGAELKFLINGNIPNIALPAKYYNLQALRDFAKGFIFSSVELKTDIMFSLGEDGEEFGNSFSTELNSDVFLKELVRMLVSFDLQNS